MQDSRDEPCRELRIPLHNKHNITDMIGCGNR